MRAFGYILFTLYSLSQLAMASEATLESLSKAAQKVDIFMWGEIHEVPAQAKLLVDFLSLPTSLEFEAVGTEYVPGHMQAALDEYVRNPLNVADSTGEKKFFAALTAEQLIWPRTEGSRQILRAFWNLKQRKPTIKICAIDFQWGDAAQNQLAWETLPLELKNKVSKISGLPIDKVVDQGLAYVREAKIAESMVSCSGGSRKMLTHTGSYHVMSPSLFVEPKNWLPSSGYVQSLLPDLRIFTFYHSLHPKSVSDPMSKKFDAWVLKNEMSEAKLISAQELQANPYKDDLFLPLDNGAKMSLILWDAILIGPSLP
ncbi:MAG: hypothetical protein V4736_02355 [Bdellovibrionota bacterium]